MPIRELVACAAIALLLIAFGRPRPAQAQPTNFQHIVVIVQENRTPDNLFYALCATQKCSTTQTTGEYDIQTANWLDKKAKGGTVNPQPIPLANVYDPGHTHADFVAMCDFDSSTGACRMDGVADERCGGECPSLAELRYVDNSTSILAPYLSLATGYGWANYMFQTNQGPSFPAHLFLFGGTSAPDRADDHKGTFASENLPFDLRLTPEPLYGCIAPRFVTVQLINAEGQEQRGAALFPCFEHTTLSDLLARQKVTWRYYTPGPGSLWSAPDAIRHICEPKASTCKGAIWQHNVATYPPDVLTDIAACKLRGVSWVIPSAQYSDHAKNNTGGGPAWVAGIVNAIGSSPCTNADGSSYWDSTAIVITWDDWGGWYDHEKPTFLAFPEGGYQYGFRVPMLFVSAYTAAGYINNQQLDFGSVERFIEQNFGIREGALGFADARAKLDLSSFYSFSKPARSYVRIPAPDLVPILRRDANLEPPDDD